MQEHTSSEANPTMLYKHTILVKEAKGLVPDQREARERSLPDAGGRTPQQPDPCPDADQGLGARPNNLLRVRIFGVSHNLKMTNQETYKDSPFNEDFCTHLEYHLCKTFEKSSRPDLKGFWCDGVSWNPTPDRQLDTKSVNDTRRIVTKAWIGKDGQDEYEMTIQLGKFALRKYAKGAKMIDCIPSAESMDWIDIDTESKKIELRLE